MEYVFKTACPKCGKPKALKTVTHVDAGGTVHISKAKCHKCGFSLSSQIILAGNACRQVQDPHAAA